MIDSLYLSVLKIMSWLSSVLQKGSLKNYCHKLMDLNIFDLPIVVLVLSTAQMSHLSQEGIFKLVSEFFGHGPSLIQELLCLMD